MHSLRKNSKENHFRVNLVSYKLEALFDYPTAEKDNDKSSVA